MWSWHKLFRRHKNLIKLYMHLFIFDMFISIDNLSPIIHAISKKNKVLLLNLNVIQDHSSRNNPLINFLLKKKKNKVFTKFYIL